MTDADLTAALASTLDDHRLSRGEKRALAELLRAQGPAPVTTCIKHEHLGDKFIIPIACYELIVMRIKCIIIRFKQLSD